MKHRMPIPINHIDPSEPSVPVRLVRVICFRTSSRFQVGPGLFNPTHLYSSFFVVYVKYASWTASF